MLIFLVCQPYFFANQRDATSYSIGILGEGHPDTFALVLPLVFNTDKERLTGYHQNTSRFQSLVKLLAADGQPL